MVAKRYAGIDQGTTSSRIMVVEEDGLCSNPFVLGHQQIYPKTNWVEHDPEELIKNLRTCLDQVGTISAFGIDNQGESVVAWDAETGKPVYNIIVWQDSRTQNVIEQLKAEGHESWVQKKCGLPLDPYFSASKMGWIINNVPEAQSLLSKGRLRIATTDAFFMDRLCGVYATDYNTASRTSLLNLETLEWDSELCKLFGIPIEALPPIRPTTGIFGYCDVNGVKTPLSASIVDQFAGVFGHGCRNPGDAKATFGTGAFMQSLSGTSCPSVGDSGLLPMLAWKFPDEPALFGLDGGVYNAVSAINWARRLGLFTEFDEINQFSKPAAILRDIIFVPALSGLGCPYWDRTAVASWTGMSLDTERADLMQAMIEGIAFRSASVIMAMDKVAPIGTRISIDGGMSVNPYFRQFLANLLNREIVVPANSELSVYGTALLARQGVGIRSPLPASGKELVISPETMQSQELMERFLNILERCRGLRTIENK
ncbi:carbohydrate kinase [Betaproteobacteria bacterium]|nr:carbohydrate kinase [Betaproteobacteria bacterium]